MPAPSAAPRRILRNSAKQSAQEKIWYQQIVEQPLESDRMHRYGSVDTLHSRPIQKGIAYTKNEHHGCQAQAVAKTRRSRKWHRRGSLMGRRISRAGRVQE